jgi:hypothetical protein
MVLKDELDPPSRISIKDIQLLLVEMSNAQFHTGRPPGMAEEEPAIPIDPQTAKDRARFVRESIAAVETLQREGKTPAQIEAAVPTFKRDYDKLYEMIMRPGGYHKQSLTTMLAMLDRMGSGQLTQHGASVIVGQRIYESFVKPQVDSIPPQ